MYKEKIMKKIIIYLSLVLSVIFNFGCCESKAEVSESIKVSLINRMGFIIYLEDNHVVVIDGGFASDAPLLELLLKNKIIDAWFITHLHDDHVGAFNTLMVQGDLEVETIYYSKYSPNIYYTLEPQHNVKETYEMFCSAIENQNAVAVNTNDHIYIDGIDFHVILSGLDTIDEINDTSMILKIEEYSVLFLADATKREGECLMEEHEEDLASNIVQLGHHGGKSVSKDVYEKINPIVGIWSFDPDFVRTNKFFIEVKEWLDEIGVIYHINIADQKKSVVVYKNGDFHIKR
jgi:beta-lactamase superfamily II metal-dependent hydrolase